MIAVGCVPLFGTQPTDSLQTSYWRTDTLAEVAVVAVGPKKAVRTAADGSLELAAGYMGEGAGIAGADDPIAFLRTLPAVSTNGELNAALNVRGSHNGANTFMADGARIVNPMHMLGIYSAFNSAYFSRYTFFPSRLDATRPNTTAALFEAYSPDSRISRPKGMVSVGIIESHGAVHLPTFKGKGLFSVGARRTYLSLLFPNILQLGTSSLKYGFTDINASYTCFLGNSNTIKGSFLYSNDALKAFDRHNGSKDGNFGWDNLSANLLWSNEVTEGCIAYTRFANEFQLSEAGRQLDLPSSLSQLCIKASHRIRCLTIEGDATWRHTSEQYNRAMQPYGDSRKSDAIEGNIGLSWRHDLPYGIDLVAGLRTAVYSCGSYFTLAPMPRISIGRFFTENLYLNLSVGRYMRFDRLVEESSTGLPADFYINCTAGEKPEDTWETELGLSGKIPGVWMEFSLEAYFKNLRHCGEFAGSILDLLNASYNPLSDLLDGRGYAYGLAVSLTRQFGPLRGRIGYNIGKSRLKFDRYGDGYFPSAHDRLHDLSVSVMWNPVRILTLGATFTYATGAPYTRAKYGYIIAENLICEYYPHNSSRLPSYRRLDLSASLRLGHHCLSLSVYNALANRNILFLYTTYSLSDGVSTRESVMKAVIPTISYSFSFQ